VSARPWLLCGLASSVVLRVRHNAESLLADTALRDTVVGGFFDGFLGGCIKVSLRTAVHGSRLDMAALAARELAGFGKAIEVTSCCRFV